MKMYCGVCKTFYDKEYELTKELETTKKLLKQAKTHIDNVDEWDGEYFVNWESELSEWLSDYNDLARTK